MFIIFALTHEPSRSIWFGVARKEDKVVHLPLGQALRAFFEIKSETFEFDDFTIRTLDESDDFMVADDLAQQVIERVRIMDDVTVLNAVRQTTFGVGTTVPTPGEAPETPPVGHSMRQKAKAAGLKYTTVMNRITRGWTERQALELDPPPPRKKQKRAPKREVTIGGVTKPYSVWCAENNISIETALGREKMGWETERAVTEPVQERR